MNAVCRQKRIPRAVHIGGHRIRIVRKRIPEYGLYDHCEGTITLRTRLPDKEAWSTLRHEMMEAALFISGVAWMTRYDQEPIVRAMEEIFFPAWEKLVS